MNKQVDLTKVQQRAAVFFEEIGWQSAKDPLPKIVIDPQLDADFRFENQTISVSSPEHAFYALTKYGRDQATGQLAQKSYLAALKERCLMIDIGRKFYSLADLKAIVRSMACFQFTHLQLHFSENEGFRIESQQFPEIVSEECLTKQEIRELIAYAQNHEIAIIPDFDSPGHLRQVLAQKPQWQLLTADGTRDDRALNILDSEAVAFIQEVYREYAQLFEDSTYFHIGADEFIDFDQLENFPQMIEAARERYGEKASGIEVFIDYVNELAAFVESLGFVVRVWNDGFYRLNRQEQTTLTENCQISYWTRWNQNMAPADVFFEKGYTMINHNDNFFYYVLGEAAGYTYPTYEKISNEFQLTTFANGQQVAQEQLAQTQAIALSVWADVPEAQTSREVIQAIFWLQTAISQKVYNEPNRPKETFRKLYDGWEATFS
ncbi:hexosaminidase [Enterococcus sp. AZ141]|uniref:family 20 glycosylhydrolase n=1 Tax=Enterococcus sp. AZ141 TaxID=2774681 RepID=UPI003F29F314